MICRWHSKRNLVRKGSELVQAEAIVIVVNEKLTDLLGRTATFCISSRHPMNSPNSSTRCLRTFHPSPFSSRWLFPTPRSCCDHLYHRHNNIQHRYIFSDIHTCQQVACCHPFSRRRRLPPENPCGHPGREPRVRIHCVPRSTTSL